MSDANGRLPRGRKLRLDLLLPSCGLAASRERARALIVEGLVRVDGVVERSPGRAVHLGADVTLAEPDHPYVSRGGVKLAGALDALAVDPAGLRAIDVGASTGGFTDCLLQRGAAHVTAVDVGHGLLDWKLRNDPRVRVVERLNARLLAAADVDPPYDLAVIDVSFISLRLVLPPVVPLVRPTGLVLPLVKPQFEAPRGSTKRGVVTDPAIRRKAVGAVESFATALGLVLAGRCDSPIRGAKGNLETFLLLRRS